MTHQLTDDPRPRTSGDPVSASVFTQPDPDTIRSWDRLVNDTSYSDVAQLSAWSTVRRQVGFLPLYVLARRAGRLVGGALVLQRRLPMLGVVGYLPYGPVIAAGDARAAAVHALSATLADLGHQHLGSLFVQPPAGAEDVSDQLAALGFRPSAAGIAPNASIRIDLTRDVEDIRGAMTKTNRRYTRNAAERGVAVRIGDERDLPILADLLARTAVHQHFDPLSLDYIAALYRELNPGGHVTVFIAEMDGVPAAVELFTGCGGVLKSRLTGTQRSGPARQSGAAAVLAWRAILWAKANGYHTVDLGGLAAESVDTIRAGGADLASRLAGPDYFKASFGGQPFRYPPARELISSPVLRIGYDLSRRSAAGGKVVAKAKRLMRHG